MVERIPGEVDATLQRLLGHVALSSQCMLQPTRQGGTRAQGKSRYRHGRLDWDVKT